MRRAKTYPTKNQTISNQEPLDEPSAVQDLAHEDQEKMQLSMPAIKDDAIFDEITRRYEIPRAELQFIGGFDNYIYEYQRADENFIMRLTPASHRDKNALRGELDWIQFLTNSGVPVCRPVSSKAGDWIETIDTAEQRYYAVSFEKAPGESPLEKKWDATLFENWGRVMGRMHLLTKKYEPYDATIRRKLWNENPYFTNFRDYLPASQNRVIERCLALVERISAFPTDKDSFGLVHADMHPGNFFTDQGRITVFDFDDCAYDWFANDIAVALFYALQNPAVQQDRTGFAQNFLEHFMAGYETENNIASDWFARLQDFLKLRAIIMYVILLNKWGAQRLSREQKTALSSFRYNIENDTPFVELTFSGRK